MHSAATKRTVILCEISFFRSLKAFHDDDNGRWWVVVRYSFVRVSERVSVILHVRQNVWAYDVCVMMLTWCAHRKLFKRKNMLFLPFTLTQSHTHKDRSEERKIHLMLKTYCPLVRQTKIEKKEATKTKRNIRTNKRTQKKKQKEKKTL